MTNKKGFLQNSAWGLASNILQNLFLSVFFVIIVNKLPLQDYSNYLIANSLYQAVASFSALGLGQWFIRQLNEETDFGFFLNKFLKIQILAGLFFYAFYLGFIYLLYDDNTVRILGILIGVNIVFDNIIYGVKHLNIAQFEQNKTFIVLIIEAVAKLLLGLVIYIYPYTVIEMTVILVILRIITLNLFLKISTSKLASIQSIIRLKISYSDFKKLVIANWPFIIVGSVAVIYWRVGSVLISKFLSVTDVTLYEIGYKFFSLAQVIPVILSASVFPELLKAYNEKGLEEFKKMYKLFYKVYLLFGFLVFSFMYSFANLLINLAFKDSLSDAGFYTQEMFLTMLVFPTALLQANVLIVLKLEKTDMWFNVISFIVNFLLAFFGLMYFKSLSIINLSILASFVVFHLLQDNIMVKYKISSVKHVFWSYLLMVLAWLTYTQLSVYINQYLLFSVFWAVVIGVFVLTDKQILAFIKQKLGTKTDS